MIAGGSLFSGIGGFELGARMAGLPVDWRWQVEIDGQCRRVLDRHFPDTDRGVADVTQAGRHNLAPVDVICGGFPCQDISVAGNGAGLAGARSGLFFEFARIVREIRPRAVVMENVSALLNRGLDVVLGTMAEIGYDAEWDCIPASAVGAPHRRDRVWIVAYPHGGRCEVQRRADPEPRLPPGPYADGCLCARSHVADSDCINGRSGRTRGIDRRTARHEGHPDPVDATADSNDARQPNACGRCRQEADGRALSHSDAAPSWATRGGWLPPSPIRRVDDGFPSGVDGHRLRRRRDIGRVKALGNAIVPQASVPAWRRVAEILDLEVSP